MFLKTFKSKRRLELWRRAEAMDLQQLKEQHKYLIGELFLEVSLKDDKLRILNLMITMFSIHFCLWYSSLIRYLNLWIGKEFLDDYFRQVRDTDEDGQSFACVLATEYFKEAEGKIDMMTKLLWVFNQNLFFIYLLCEMTNR